MKLGSTSVDSALDFDASNQSKLNFWERDFNLLLLVKDNSSLLLRERPHRDSVLEVRSPN